MTDALCECYCMQYYSVNVKLKISSLLKSSIERMAYSQVLYKIKSAQASSDISINGNRNGNDFFREMESKNGNELEMELE